MRIYDYEKNERNELKCFAEKKIKKNKQKEKRFKNI